MVQAWWAAGLAVPVVLIRGLVTNNNKAKQKESQNDRLPAAVPLSSCFGSDRMSSEPEFPSPVVTVDLTALAQILALSVRECAHLTDSPGVWAG